MVAFVFLLCVGREAYQSMAKNYNKTVSVVVGSKTFVLDVDALDRYPGSTISAAYRFNPEKQSIDFSYRSPERFQVVYDLYCTSKLIIPDSLSYNDLKEELDFWGFDLKVPFIECSKGYTQQSERTSTPSVKCPWGTYSKHVGQSCWMPLVCYVWNSILSSSVLVDSVAVGYRDITLFIKHDSSVDQAGVSMLLSHKRFVERLAELSKCRLTFVDGLYGHSVFAESRTQDLFLDYAPRVTSWNYVHHKTVPVSCCRSGNDVLVTAQGVHKIEIPWRGFTVTLEVNQETVYWNCSVDLPGEDPIYLSDLSGFLLRVSFVIEDTVYEGFNLPSLLTRYHPFRFALYRCKTYTAQEENWFCNLASLESEDVYPHLSEAYLEHVKSIVILVEEAEQGVADLQRVTNSHLVNHSSFYERLNITLPLRST